MGSLWVHAARGESLAAVQARPGKSNLVKPVAWNKRRKGRKRPKRR